MERTSEFIAERTSHDAVYHDDVILQDVTPRQ